MTAPAIFTNITTLAEARERLCEAEVAIEKLEGGERSSYSMFLTDLRRKITVMEAFGVEPALITEGSESGTSRARHLAMLPMGDVSLSGVDLWRLAEKVLRASPETQTAVRGEIARHVARADFWLDVIFGEKNTLRWHLKDTVPALFERA